MQSARAKKAIAWRDIKKSGTRKRAVHVYRSFFISELEVNKLVAARIGKTESDADKNKENGQPPYGGEFDGRIKTVDELAFPAGFKGGGQCGGEENDNAENAPGTYIHRSTLPKENSTDYIPCNREAGGAEEYPTEDYEYISENAGDNDRNEKQSSRESCGIESARGARF